eukprot:CAMPEP_0115857000 /NCGR_PEP_ID=MMETSP0287-20121206/15346_1 /TAXON_ID=412157 /ORGANISM="Chrysochromulina rotalis, Strain UIO044" /LENGTH=51 /DNA_ID=CAMNT_0003311199 /DNA_START=406 /DNA_END=557 /DNA_ORIENTATION=+
MTSLAHDLSAARDSRRALRGPVAAGAPVATALGGRALPTGLRPPRGEAGVT